MDGNDSPNISWGDSDSYNQSILTSSLNAQVDSYIVNDQGDSYQGDSYIVNSETRSAYSQHSGSVN